MHTKRSFFQDLIRYPNSFATDAANPTMINSSLNRSRSTMGSRNPSISLNLLNRSKTTGQRTLGSSRSQLLRLSVLSDLSRERNNHELNYQETSLCGENNLCVHSAHMYNTGYSLSACTSPDIAIDKHIYIQSDSEPPSVMRIEVSTSNWPPGK